MDEQHPALRLNNDPGVIAEALRQALASVVGLDTGSPAAEPPDSPGPAWSSIESESELFDESPMGSEHPG
jgi:hypothetical protein